MKACVSVGLVIWANCSSTARNSTSSFVQRVDMRHSFSIQAMKNRSSATRLFVTDATRSFMSGQSRSWAKVFVVVNATNARTRNSSVPCTPSGCSSCPKLRSNVRFRSAHAPRGPFPTAREDAEFSAHGTAGQCREHLARIESDMCIRKGMKGCCLSCFWISCGLIVPTPIALDSRQSSG